MKTSETITNLNDKIKTQQISFNRLAAEIKKLEDHETSIRAKRDKANDILKTESESDHAKSSAKKTYNNLTDELTNNASLKKQKVDARSEISRKITSLQTSIKNAESVEFQDFGQDLTGIKDLEPLKAKFKESFTFLAEMKSLTGIADSAKLLEMFKAKIQPQNSTNNPHQH